MLGFGLLADRGDGIAGRGRGNPELPEAPDFPPPITSDAIAAPRAYMDALAASASAGPMIGMLATAEAAFAAMTGVWLTIWDSACAFWMVCAVLPLCYAPAATESIPRCANVNVSSMACCFWRSASCVASSSRSRDCCHSDSRWAA